MLRLGFQAALTFKLSPFLSPTFGDVQIGRHHGQAKFTVGKITGGGGVYYTPPPPIILPTAIDDDFIF